MALAVFAARCREIRLYAGDTPYLDQWWVEGQQIIVPWLQGKLGWTDFFRSHHEHIPMWTRLLAWFEAALLGRWDPLLQCTINAALFGLAAGVWTGWLRRRVPLLPALALTMLTVAFAVLPHGWENSTWGFQSLVPIALLFVFWHICGSLETEVGSPSWWLAQAAGLGALFTFGSMWAAPAAVALVTWWTAAPGRWRWLTPTLLAVTGFILLVVARAHQPHSGAFVLTAGSLPQFVAAFLLLLGWPSQWPGAALLIHLPVLLLALKLRRNAKAENADRVALALGVYAMAQAAAFAYGRAGGYVGFVSRYGDLLFPGVLANGFALWRLLHAERAGRPLLALLAAGWLVGCVGGLQWISTRAHTEYFHGHAPAWTALRHNAVKQYIATHDATALNSHEVQAVLYPDPAVVTEVLDQPGLRELLPVSVRPDGPRARGDFVSAAASYVRNLWPTWLATAGLVFLLGVAFTIRDGSHAVPASSDALPEPWRLRVLAGLAVVAVTGIFLWPMPLEFRGEKRWGRWLNPPGTVSDLNFLITTPTPYPADRLVGGAALWPEDFRNTFFGTHIDGPAFTGRAQSSLFPIHSPWLVIPYAGFPASAGNGISLQIEDETGQVVAELTCPGPNPPDIAFWNVDVRAHQGRRGRIVMSDGRDGAEGWLAVAPPQPAPTAEQGERAQQSWTLERTAMAHDSLGVIAAGLAGLTVIFAFAGRRDPRGKIYHRTGATRS